MRIGLTLLLLFVGFCFIVAAIVSLSVTIAQIVSTNLNDVFGLGAEMVKMPVKEQILRTLLYAGELALGTFLIYLGFYVFKDGEQK